MMILKSINDKWEQIKFSIGNFYPILTDQHDQGGVMSGHYFHQDLYVVRLIHEANPVKHIS